MEEFEAMTGVIRCSSAVVDSTLAALQQSGVFGREGIVLWLGKRSEDHITVMEAYVPIHVAKRDMFHIPPEGMRALHARMRPHRWMIAAQVHSHPERAFHSHADDKWAIVRHLGALSIVVPYFARGVTAANFLSVCATFELSADNDWVEVLQPQIASRCLIA